MFRMGVLAGTLSSVHMAQDMDKGSLALGRGGAPGGHPP